MSLPTPPGTSHRDKENKFSGFHVVWSATNHVHVLSSGTVPNTPTGPRKNPMKSILKKQRRILLDEVEDKPREVTPEPSDPLADLRYLEYPCSQIIAPESTLADLIAAYSILAARLRSSVGGLTDADASWPLFQPLRKNCDAIVDAFIRDLGRALVAPSEGCSTLPESREKEATILPSPQPSPQKKKQGMSEEQVKHARDLCTTSHAVIKLLAVIFCLPAVYGVFSNSHLTRIMNRVLTIPLAGELPTPNARKTCALAIWLLQTQRLPAKVLGTMKDTIAHALRRGMGGELGKEGKKGSASDSLKAVHDLSVYQPDIFIPAFTEILPSVLSNLLAPTLPLRSQACNALGGFVYGCVSLPSSPLFGRISRIISSFLTSAPPPTPSKSSPKKANTDSLIVKALRLVLAAQDPQHVAQGPVWGLLVVSYFIILLGPALCSDVKLNRTVTALFTISTRHKKSSVRAMACLTWRCLTWAYVRPPFVLHGEESEVDNDSDESQKEKDAADAQDAFWNIVKSVLDMGAGSSTVVSIVNGESISDLDLRRAFSLTSAMIKRGGQTTDHGVNILKGLVSFEAVQTAQWCPNKLLPTGLFLAMPGLLTAEFSQLSNTIRPMLDQCPAPQDIRSLSKEDISTGWIFDNLVELWKEGIASLDLSEGDVIPIELLEIWSDVLKANVTVLRESGDEEGVSKFARRAVGILAELLQDPNLDLTWGPAANTLPTPSPTKRSGITFPGSAVDPGLKLFLTNAFWKVLRKEIPAELLGSAGDVLLKCLVDLPDEDFWEMESARKYWGSLCAEVLAMADADALKAFWAGKHLGTETVKWDWAPEVRSAMWRLFEGLWLKEEENSWESSIVLLTVPLSRCGAWELTAEDVESWDTLCGRMTLKALDCGMEADVALNHLAQTISEDVDPSLPSTTRVVDTLLGQLDLSDSRELPESLFELVNLVLVSSYPPEPKNKVLSMWLIRSLARLIEICPPELVENLLMIVQDGCSTWVTDDYKALTEQGYTDDVISLYQIALVRIQFLPPRTETILELSTLIESGLCREPSTAEFSDVFAEFGKPTFSSVEEPADGWPEKIAEFVRSTGQVKVKETTEDEDEEMEVIEVIDLSGSEDPPETVVSMAVDCEEPITVLDSDDEELSLKSELKSSAGLVEIDTEENLSCQISFFSPSKRPDPRACSPQMVTVVSETPSTPPRPSRTLPAEKAPSPCLPRSIFQSLPLRPPTSPLPVTLQCPVTPKRGSPVRSAVVSLTSTSDEVYGPANKENLTPLFLMERNTVVPNASTLGKRRLIEEDEEDERTSKKPRKFSSLPFPLLGNPSSKAEPSVRDLAPRTKSIPSMTRKRSGLFLDAVEVPTLRELRTRRFASTISGETFKPDTPTYSPGPGTPGTIQDYTRNRRRHSEVTPSRRASSPLRQLRSMPLPASDDSIMREASPQQADSSSDDDPYIGQVTPHRLLSPSLRRVSTLDSDPQSDDSTMVASPSRDAASRRLRRIEKFSQPTPVKPLRLRCASLGN